MCPEIVQEPDKRRFHTPAPARAHQDRHLICSTYEDTSQSLTHSLRHAVHCWSAIAPNMQPRAPSTARTRYATGRNAGRPGRGHTENAAERAARRRSAAWLTSSSSRRPPTSIRLRCATAIASPCATWRARGRPPGRAARRCRRGHRARGPDRPRRAEPLSASLPGAFHAQTFSNILKQNSCVRHAPRPKCMAGRGSCTCTSSPGRMGAPNVKTPFHSAAEPSRRARPAVVDVQRAAAGVGERVAAGAAQHQARLVPRHAPRVALAQQVHVHLRGRSRRACFRQG
jgi:hypothetical protein